MNRLLKIRIFLVETAARIFGRVPLISIGGRWFLMILGMRGRTWRDEIKLLRDMMVDLLDVLLHPFRMRNPQTRSHLHLVNTEGMKFDPRPGSDDAYHMTPWRERDVEAFIRRILQTHRGVFVDAGANVGYYTLLACKSGVPVVAVEAHPQTFECLERHVRLNGCDQCQIVNRALWDRTGEVLSLEAEAFQYGGAHLVTGEQTDWRVETITLDDLLKDVEQVCLIKMDIEGSEGHALRGASRVLERTHAIAVEVRDPENVPRISRLLVSAGFMVQPSRFSSYLLALRP